MCRKKKVRREDIDDDCERACSAIERYCLHIHSLQGGLGWLRNFFIRSVQWNCSNQFAYVYCHWQVCTANFSIFFSSKLLNQSRSPFGHCYITMREFKQEHNTAHNCKRKKKHNCVERLLCIEESLHSQLSNMINLEYILWVTDHVKTGHAKKLFFFFFLMWSVTREICSRYATWPDGIPSNLPHHGESLQSCQNRFVSISCHLQFVAVIVWWDELNSRPGKGPLIWLV